MRAWRICRWKRTVNLLTEADTLEAGKSYLITRKNGNDLYAMKMTDTTFGVTTISAVDGKYYLELSTNINELLWNVNRQSSSYSFQNCGNNRFLAYEYEFLSCSLSTSSNETFWSVNNNAIYCTPYYISYNLNISSTRVTLSSQNASTISFFTVSESEVYADD